jgi:hypothetical protein
VEASQAFVEYFFDVLNFGIATGQTRELEGLAKPGCESCAAIVRNIKHVYDGGGSVDSDGWKLRSITQAFPGPDHTVALDLKVTLTREQITRSPSAEPEIHAPAKQKMRATVHWTQSGWLMQELELVAS